MHWKIKKKTISIIFNANFDTFDNIKPTPYSSQKKNQIDQTPLIRLE